MQRYTVYLYLETALYVFGWYFHPSPGAHTTVSTASGICHTVTVICRYRGRVGTGLSVLWVGGWMDTDIDIFITHTILCSDLMTGWTMDFVTILPPVYSI
jgi:hypothetical protein